MESSGPLKTPAPFFLLTTPLISPRNSTIPIRPPTTVTTSAATNSLRRWSSTEKFTSARQPASPFSVCCLSLSRVRSAALRAHAGLFLEFRQRGNAECFENLNLHIIRDRVYFLHPWPARSDAIPERPFAATALAPRVFSAFQLIYRGCGICSRLDHHRVDSLRSQFVAIDFRERFERKLARAVQTHSWNRQAPRSAADVQQQSAPLAFHGRKNRSVHPQDAEKIRVKLPPRLRHGHGLRQVHDPVACVVH